LVRRIEGADDENRHGQLIPARAVIPDCVTAKQNEMTMKGMKQNRLPILIDVGAGATSASDSAAA